MTEAPHDHTDYPTIGEVEDAISNVYREAAKIKPGVTLNHEAEPLRTLWAMADAKYAEET